MTTQLDPKSRPGPQPSLAAAAAVNTPAAEPQIFYACYRAKKGDVYRIREGETKLDCDKGDVLFNWNAAGPRGLQGEAGAKGEQGQAGNLALAGQSCPTGFFVSAFNSAGSIVCRNAAGEEPREPPPPPGQYDGSWTIEPRLSSDCNAFFGYTVEGVNTQVSGSTLNLTVKGHAGPNNLSPYTMVIPLDYTESTHAFEGSASRNSSAGGAESTLTFSVSGQFTGTASFTATVAVNGVLHTPLSNDNCDPISAAVTGARAS